MIVPAVDGCKRQLTRSPPEFAMYPTVWGTGVVEGVDVGVTVGVVGVSDPDSSRRKVPTTHPLRLPQTTGYQPFDTVPRINRRVPSGSEAMIDPVVLDVVRQLRRAPPVFATTPYAEGTAVPVGEAVGVMVAVGDGVSVGLGLGVGVGDGVEVGEGAGVGVWAEGVPQISTSAR